MKHTPWTQEQAEKWAIDFCKSSRPLEWSVEEKQAFLAGLQKAAEIIEASPTVWSHNGGIWASPDSMKGTVHHAKLIGAGRRKEAK